MAFEDTLRNTVNTLAMTFNPEVGMGLLKQQEQRKAEGIKQLTDAVVTGAMAPEQAYQIAQQQGLPLPQGLGPDIQAQAQQSVIQQRDLTNSQTSGLRQSLKTAMNNPEIAKQYKPEQVAAINSVIDSGDPVELRKLTQSMAFPPTQLVQTQGGGLTSVNRTTNTVTPVDVNPYHAPKGGGQPSISMGGDDLKSAGAEIKMGVPESQVISGYGASASVNKETARREAIKQIKEETGMNDIQAGRELALRKVEYKSMTSSDRQLNTMQRATEQAATQLDYNIDQATKIMKDLPSTDLSPILNAIMRGQEKWTGDPKYSSLFFHLSGAAIEAARMRSGGQASIAQLHQGAAEEAKQWASINMTPASWKEVAKSMKGEGQIKIEGYRSARKNQRDQLGNTQQATPTTGWSAKIVK